MYHAIRGGLTLAVLIIVIGLFLPEVGAKLIELITAVIDLLLYGVDQVSASLPQ